MAHKKAGGSSRNGRDSQAKRLGVKRLVRAGGRTKFGWMPPRYQRVPICILCWLDDIAASYFRCGRGNGSYVLSEECQRLRCDGCGRPMRVRSRRWNGPAFSERVCCVDCDRKAVNARANERRRVRHTKRACAVCGRQFVPTRSDARTCGNRCRQKLHRERHKGGRWQPR